METDLLFKTETALSERGISPETLSTFLIKEGVNIQQNALKIQELVEFLFSADNNTIYRDDYAAISGKFQIIGLRKLPSQMEFLNILGYTYVSTHRDMRIGDRKKASESLTAEELAYYVFENYPLVGEYRFSPAEKEKLLSSATNIFNKVLTDKPVRIEEDTVLTLEIILLARYDEKETEDNEDTDKRFFWKSIIKQLGVQSDEEKYISFIRTKLVDIIERTFLKHKRYLRSSKKNSNFMVPYTPIRLHSLYPKESIYSLFNILLGYYGDELDSQYVENDDRTYIKLAKSIGEKQNGNNILSENEKVKVRSDKMMSGLCALFNDRVFYAAKLCEGIIKRIDALLRCYDTDLIKPEESRWDELLIKWFSAKCSEKPALLSKTYHATERIITRSENIHAVYTLDDDCISFSFPSIRLGERAESSPEVTVYSGDKVIYSRPLKCYGNEVTTVRAFKVLLSDLSANNSLNDRFDYRVRIDFKCAGFSDYDSADTLKRNYIVFGENGNEISTGSIKSNSTIRIACLKGHELSVDGADNVFSSEKLVKITSFSFLDNTSVLYDGESIFRGSAARSRFTAHTSIPCMTGIRVISEGRDFSLFNSPFDITVEIPDELTALHDYRVYNGEYVYSLKELCGEKRHFTLHCDTADTASYIAIKDITTGKTDYPMLYAIINGFDFRLSAKTFLGNIQNCDAVINGTTENITVDPSTDIAEFSANGLTLAADVPIIHCDIDGTDIFSGSGFIWHDDLSYNSVIAVRVPNGFTAEVQMNGKRLLNTSNGRDFQIGAYSPDSNKSYETAILLLTDCSSSITRIKLLDVVYSEMFRTSYEDETPVRLEKGKIIWQPEHLFIGKADTIFTIELYDANKQSLATLSASTQNTEISCPSLVNDGWISCEVSIIEDGLFSSGKKTIFKKTIPLGNKDSFRFTGKTLHLENYRYYDFRSKQVIRRKLNEFTGYLCDISFTGEYTSPQYGMNKYPKYTAVLKFYAIKSGKYIPYKFNKDGEGINPVFVWRLPNDNLMISPSDDEEGSLNIECDGNRISQGDGIPIDYYTYTTR